MTLTQANALVTRLHRHHKPAVGHRFSICCVEDGALVGVGAVAVPGACIRAWTLVEAGGVVK